jgi:hypothetical protein
MKRSRHQSLAVIAVVVGLAVAVPARAAHPPKEGFSDFARSHGLTVSATPSSAAGDRNFVDRTDHASSVDALAPADGSLFVERTQSLYPATTDHASSVDALAPADGSLFVERTQSLYPASTGPVAAGRSAGRVNGAFSWQDAGIGAGTAFFLVGLLGLVVVRMRHTRRSVALS